MESLIALFVLACLVTFIGGILGIVAFAKTGTLSREVQELKARVADLKRRLSAEQAGEEAPGNARPPSEDSPEVHRDLRPAAPPEVSVSEPVSVRSEASVQAPKADVPSDASASAPKASPPPHRPAANSTPALQLDPSPFFRALQRNWMAWLGGFCIALAGIFLAKYSIEQGLVGPGLRITMGILTGLALHGVAAWLRLSKGAHPALAAMAGGGSITLFATLLAALHLYQMFSPTLVFVLLALVALATMWLALSHGPLMAVIGMLGAYAVPALVSTGSGNMLAALIYAQIITVSVLLLARVVRMGWLWSGAVLGALGWWWLSLTSSQVDGLRGLYLALLAYQLMAICSGNWRLLQRHSDGVWSFGHGADQATGESAANQAIPVWERGLPMALLGIVLAQLVSILNSGWVAHWLAFLALPALLLFASLRQPRLLSLVWTLLLGSLACIVMLYTSFPSLDIGWRKAPLMQPDILLFSLANLGLLVMIAALWAYRLGQQRAWWASLLAMTPVMSFLCAYLTVSQFASQANWALLFAGLAAVQMAIAVMTTHRQRERWIGIWHFIAGHCGYALAVAVAFEAATLTLALAAQVLSLAWLIKRFDVTAIGWLLKLVVLLVVLRLTANPWLFDYPAIWHWPLWTYGGATLLCWLSSRQLVDHPKLRQWTEVASLHLFVLTVWAETRYLLHDGRVFFTEYSFTEATLYIGLAGALSLVYHQRARISHGLSRWYQGYSVLLLVFASLNYLGILLNLMNSESWALRAISAQPVFNMLTLSLGFPVLLGLLFARYYRGAKKPAALLVGVASFIFVSFQVRHLWQGTVSLQTSTSAGELYTYSAVWLLMAVAAMLWGGMRQWQNMYRGGLAVLSIVILKIFFIDLSDLDGLLRVASFMGLGLALVGISFLHQKLKPGARAGAG
ncbi:DUF2339 domain-containing protein [Wenzhouxiangella marina]|uniref:Membrane protein-like protein n=1 Tax=Wenzhouxiangella marina TaxID=1579979 RepID=A0A0K0XV48_9GAMM|nr:DUF2339 domain-containing protein [Wenzhouxiangella marina]AKS41540.1 Membrane protein-like protein [Wenzhouxiangella marina]MBB6086701.1 putative membrane protein [Wenzhouxiangella marina]